MRVLPKRRKPDLHQTPRIRRNRASRWLLIGGWLLMMPPLPLGTELPPLSEWSPVSTHKTAEDCEAKGEEVRNAARRMLTGDPNASANSLAAAMGRLQVTCVQDDAVEPPAEPEAKPPAGRKPQESK